jgi:hypothetical protein
MEILLLFVGIAVLVWGFILLLRNMKLNKNGVKMEAEIIDVRKKQQQSTDVDGYTTSSDMYYPVYRYTYEGEEYTQESTLGVSNSKKYRKGDKINIVFMADKPNKPHIRGAFNLWFLPGLLMFLGIIFIISFSAI